MYQYCLYTTTVELLYEPQRWSNWRLQHFLFILFRCWCCWCCYCCCCCCRAFWLLMVTLHAEWLPSANSISVTLFIVLLFLLIRWWCDDHRPSSCEFYTTTITQLLTDYSILFMYQYKDKSVLIASRGFLNLIRQVLYHSNVPIRSYILYYCLVLFIWCRHHHHHLWLLSLPFKVQVTLQAKCCRCCLPYSYISLFHSVLRSIQGCYKGRIGVRILFYTYLIPSFTPLVLCYCGAN